MEQEQGAARRQLLAEIRARFDLARLRTLAAELAVDWDELAGDTKSAKGMELILYMERNGRFAELEQQVLQTVPSRRQPRGEARDRHDMLNLVHRFWVEDVLDKLRPPSSAIPLNLIERKTAVVQPWDVHRPDENDRVLPPNSRIADIFADMSGLNQTLLILGQPGSGKTMTLLELARDTIAWAKADPDEPIPVVLNLASWGQKQLPLAAWLLDELKSKYRLPDRIGRRWVEAEELLLLLDGLDEVAEPLRDDCVRAINNFHESNTMPIVVCCRSEDYATLPEKLTLQTAVELQPLTPPQIQTYLQQADTESTKLAQLLQENEDLQQLAQQPLMLTIMATAYQDMASSQTLATLTSLDDVADPERHLLRAYTKQMFQRGSKSQPFSTSQTLHWLSWLARQMGAHGQTIFVPEQLQPSWLANLKQQRLYVALSRLLISLGGALVGGLIIGLGLFLFFDTISLGEGLLRGFSEGLLSGLLAGFFVAALDLLWTQETEPPPNGAGVRLLILNIVVVGLGIFLLVWAGIGFGFGSLNWLGFSQAFWLFEGQQVALLTALCFSLIFGYEPRGSRRAAFSDIRVVEYLNLSAARAAEGAIIWALVGAAVGFVRSRLEIQADPLGIALPGLQILYVAVPVFAIAGAIFGGLRGSVLTSQPTDSQTSTSLFKYTVLVGAGIGLVFGLLGALIGGVALGGQGALAFGVYGLLVGLLAIVWYGGFNVVKHYVLRILLAYGGEAPWRLTAFLDYAAQRIFLRRGGGGYLFLHRALLEYFAALTLQEIELFADELSDM